MHRLLVALLSAFDAVIAAAAGLAVVLAPLTLLWVVGLGGSAEWSALWPATASIWQLGNLVPLRIDLPDLYLAQTGIPADAATFSLSIAPLAFAAFTAIFAARSGARAARAGSWFTGVVSGGAVFAVLAAAVALTSRNPIARPSLWQAILVPVLVYVLAGLAGAIVGAWRHGDDGAIDRIHGGVDALPGAWPLVPALALRAAAICLTGLVGVGALVFAVGLIARGGEAIALFQASGADALGATITTLAQLAYVPTLVVWGMSWAAGPGFALGTGTAVSPAGTQLGVVPGIPILGAVPQSASPWLLLVLLLPVAVGALAGWAARSRLVAMHPPVRRDGELHEPVGPRLALTAAVAVLSAGGAALLALVASGSLGPGRLALVGPAPGPVAVAVGVEVLVGAGILLLSPRSERAQRSERAPRSDRTSRAEPVLPQSVASASPAAAAPPAAATSPAAAPGAPAQPAAPGPVPERPSQLPPLD